MMLEQRVQAPSLGSSEMQSLPTFSHCCLTLHLVPWMWHQAPFGPALHSSVHLHKF